MAAMALVLLLLVGGVAGAAAAAAAGAAAAVAAADDCGEGSACQATKDTSSLLQTVSRGGKTSAVVINELLADPDAGDGEFVELYNPGSSTLDLSGWTLVDKADNDGTWASRSVPAKGFVVVDFSRKLNNGGDTVTLRDSSGATVDTYTYTKSEDGMSWGRYPDGAGWSTSAMVPTKGAANTGSSSSTPAPSPTPPPGPTPPPAPAPPVSPPCGGACTDGICYGTWNIQNFGRSKAGRPAVMEAIRSVLGRYDVVAIQELSQKPDETPVCGPNTEQAICDARPDPSAYTVHASPRIGDEQYVAMTRNAVASAKGGATYPDPQNLHSRPPHAFELSVTSAGRQWELVVATTHTKPDSRGDITFNEIMNFPSILAWMRQTLGTSSSHYLLSGDFNADGSYFDDAKEWPNSQLNSAFNGYKLLAANDLDTTVSSGTDRAYDRIILDDSLAGGCPTCTGKVFRLEELDLRPVRTEGCKPEYKYVTDAAICDSKYDTVPYGDFPDWVKTSLAKEISDHHPVEICLKDKSGNGVDGTGVFR